jgi:hypothetical protein
MEILERHQNTNLVAQALLCLSNLAKHAKNIIPGAQVVEKICDTMERNEFDLDVMTSACNTLGSLAFSSKFHYRPKFRFDEE